MTDTPDPLGMPLQGLVTNEAMTRVHRYPEAARDVAFNPVGQVVGLMNQTKSAKQVVMDLVEEYLESTDRLKSLEEA